MPPKKKEKSAAATKAALNLQVLQRVDPEIRKIEASTAHATLYKLENGKDWKMEDVAGAFFLFSRKTAPFFGMHIMNQKAFDNYHRLIQPGDHFELESSFLMFNDDGEFYGLWFGVDDERESICKLVMAKANAAAAGTAPPVSYAASLGGGGGGGDGAAASDSPHPAAGGGAPSEQDALKSLLLNANKKQPSPGQGGGGRGGRGGGKGGGGGGSAGAAGGTGASAEQAHLAALLGAATANSNSPQMGGEQNHLQSLLAKASGSNPNGSPPFPAATASPEAPSAEGNKLAGLLLNAASRQQGGGGGGGGAIGGGNEGDGASPSIHPVETHGGIADAAAQPPPPADQTSTLLPVPPMPTVSVPTPSQLPKGPPRAPKNMAHLLQNPGTVTKVAPLPTAAKKEPSVVDRMLAGEKVDAAQAPPSDLEATAVGVQRGVTETLTELVDLQAAKSAARGQVPRQISPDELRKVLLHVLASTENQALLAAFFAHYQAIFEAKGSGQKVSHAATL